MPCVMYPLRITHCIVMPSIGFNQEYNREEARVSYSSVTAVAQGHDPFGSID